MQLASLLPHPDGKQFPQMYLKLRAGQDSGPRLCESLCLLLGVPPEAGPPALFLREQDPAAADKYIYCSCSYADAAQHITGWGNILAPELEPSADANGKPAVWVLLRLHQQLQQSGVPTQSGSVGSAAATTAAAAAAAQTVALVGSQQQQQQQQGAKATGDRPINKDWQKLTQELICRMIPCMPDETGKAPSGFRFLTMSNELNLQPAEAANLTPAEVKVKVLERTAVVHACHEAVKAGVLNVYDHAPTKNGNKVPVTETDVSDYMKKWMFDQDTQGREAKKPICFRPASVVAWRAIFASIQGGEPAALAILGRDELAHELYGGFKQLMAGMKSFTTPVAVLQMKNLPVKAVHQATARGAVTAVSNQAGDGTIRLLLNAFKAGAGLGAGAGARSTPAALPYNPLSGPTPSTALRIHAPGIQPFALGSIGGSQGVPAGRSGPAHPSTNGNQFLLAPVPPPSRARASRPAAAAAAAGGGGDGGEDSAAVDLAAAAAAAAAADGAAPAAASSGAGGGRTGGSSAGRGRGGGKWGGRGGGRGRGRQASKVTHAEGAAGPEPVLSNNDGSSSDDDEQQQAGGLACLAAAAAAAAADSIALGRGKRRRTARNVTDPDDYVMGEDEDQQRVARVLGESAAAAAAAAADVASNGGGDQGATVARKPRGAIKYKTVVFPC